MGLKSMLEFMYLGQTSFPTDEVQRFLTIAEDFDVKGLVKSFSSPPKSLEDLSKKFEKNTTSSTHFDEEIKDIMIRNWTGHIDQELKDIPKQERITNTATAFDESILE